MLILEVDTSKIRLFILCLIIGYYGIKDQFLKGEKKNIVDIVKRKSNARFRYPYTGMFSLPIRRFLSDLHRHVFVPVYLLSLGNVSVCVYMYYQIGG